MRHPIPTGIFKPRPTSIEKKTDATTRAAQQIIDDEKLAREAKTERLRLARLARAQAIITPPSPKAQPIKRRTRG
ncbi:hypothetical protein [Mesorhizobium sp. SP-1A]|uniref:hypothetical protein n=1 Tax=Mesorhizobium sp. SP-1A TaxID=3077840 RepID=UPI0028F74F71|nr:hypothetical protein [Mesorhizobium sp. SP-1A]